MDTPKHLERDRDILDRIDQRTQRTDDRVQELYDAVVGTLEDPGIQEHIRDHDRRLVALEARNSGISSRIVTLVTSVTTALASAWAYIKLSGHH